MPDVEPDVPVETVTEAEPVQAAVSTPAVVEEATERVRETRIIRGPEAGTWNNSSMLLGVPLSGVEAAGPTSMEYRSAASSDDLVIPLVRLVTAPALLPALLRYTWCTVSSVWRLNLSRVEAATNPDLELIDRGGAAAAQLVAMTDFMFLGRAEDAPLTPEERALLEYPAYKGLDPAKLMNAVTGRPNHRGVDARTQVYLTDQEVFLVLHSTPPLEVFQLLDDMLGVLRQEMLDDPQYAYEWSRQMRHMVWADPGSPFAQWFFGLQDRVLDLVRAREAAAAATFFGGKFASLAGSVVLASSLVYGQAQHVPAEEDRGACVSHFNGVARITEPTLVSVAVGTELVEVTASNVRADHLVGLLPFWGLRSLDNPTRGSYGAGEMHKGIHSYGRPVHIVDLEPRNGFRHVTEQNNHGLPTLVQHLVGNMDEVQIFNYES